MSFFFSAFRPRWDNNTAYRKSHLSPKDSQNEGLQGFPERGWKPHTLGFPILVGLALISIALFVILEYLRQVSPVSGSLRVVSVDTGALATFGYLYLPVILSVTFSMAWSWIDLDAKRLEPYFQMSRVGGALPKDSTLLQYPFEFVAVAPLKALRHGHWAVASGGFGMVVVFWLLTPLAGSVFAKLETPRKVSLPVSATSSLVSLEEQARRLDIGFLNDAYAHMWLGQALPNFTTTNSAFLPFTLNASGSGPLTEETFEASSTMYTSSLSCSPARFNLTEIPEADNWNKPAADFQFDNGKGCRTSRIRLDGSPGIYTGMFIGYNDDPEIDWSLSQLNCLGAIHTFLAIWATRSLAGEWNTTAFFCEPSYQMAETSVTVALPNTTVVDTKPLQSARPMLTDDFNFTNFEYLVGTGVGPASFEADIPQTSRINPESRLRDWNLSTPLTNLALYVVGSSQLSSAEYLDPEKLKESFEKAFQTLFVLAIRRLMSIPVSLSSPKDGELTSKGTQITMTQPLALIVEASLLVAAAFAFTLSILTYLRSSQLENDPASIARTIAMLQPPDFDYEAAGGRGPRKSSGQTAALIKGKMVGPSGSSGSHSRVRTNTAGQLVGADPSRKTILPWPMSTSAAVLFIGLLLIGLAVLVVVELKTRQDGGLPLPSHESMINQLTLNYVPIAFATILEPFWVLLNRHLCVLKPFQILQYGETRSMEALGLKYTSLPPQLTILRALKARHYLLATVCVCGLSANILAISLSAIFTTDVVHLEQQQLFELKKTAQLVKTIPNAAEDVTDQGGYLDHFYVAKTNITDATTLPPFADFKYSYIPFELHNSTSDGIESWDAETTAFGVDVVCANANDPKNQMNIFSNLLDLNATRLEIILQLADSNGVKFNCTMESFYSAAPASSGGNTTEGYYATEVASSLVNTSLNGTVEQIEMCSTTLLVALLHKQFSAESQAQTSTAATVPATDSLYLACRPNLKVIQRRIHTRPGGVVISANTSDKSAASETASFGPGQNSSTLFLTFNHMIAAGIDIGKGTKGIWHNDTNANHWFFYLVKIATQSSDFLNISLPLPSATSISPGIESVYERLFALVLTLNPDLFAAAPSQPMINGTVTVTQVRVFVVKEMYIVCLALIAFNVAVAVAYYVRRPKRMLSEMPITLASMAKHFEGSGLVEKSTTFSENQLSFPAAYGKFVGIDGQLHLGIERKPFVVPWGDG